MKQLGEVRSYFCRRSIRGFLSCLDISASSLRRHQRNLVSVMGHFVTFLLGMVHLLLPPIIYFLKGVGTTESGPVIICDFIIFIVPSMNFFVYPLIEILFSENLRNNFIEVIRWELH